MELLRLRLRNLTLKLGLLRFVFENPTVKLDFQRLKCEFPRLKLAVPNFMLAFENFMFIKSGINTHPL